MDSADHVTLAVLAEMLKASSAERGWPPTMSKFQTEIAGGSLYVGSPETVATKLAAAIGLLGLTRFDMAYALGRAPHEQRMAAIDFYGREVILRVREPLATGLATATRRPPRGRRPACG